MDNIDKIFYINLDSRVDRKTLIEQELSSMLTKQEMDDKVERFPAIYNKSGCLGCLQSHLAVLKLARERNYKYILILEDDFQFLVNKKTFNDNMTQLFNAVNNNNFKFRVVMLSYNAIEHQPFNDYLDITTNAQTASGYIISDSIIEHLINLYDYAVVLLTATGSHWIYMNDQIWKQFQNKDWYIFRERIGCQRAGFSDIGQQWVDNKV